jgi:hypothetical protein
MSKNTITSSTISPDIILPTTQTIQVSYTSPNFVVNRSYNLKTTTGTQLQEQTSLFEYTIGGYDANMWSNGNAITVDISGKLFATM